MKMLFSISLTVAMMALCCTMVRSEEKPLRQKRSGQGFYEVYPGEDIQSALESAARDPEAKLVKVHAGTYRPTNHAQAMIVFNARHDGITLEAVGEVVLTAANPDIADPLERGYPAIVNHVVYFGDGVSDKTVLRGFKITGANGFLRRSDPDEIEPYSPHPALEKSTFFYTDGGGIKVFGKSYPVIENVEIYDNFTSPCGAGISIEQRGFNENPVIIKNSIFRNNRAQVTGSAVDVLRGSSVVIENCLFVSNVSNVGIDFVSGQDRGREGYNQKHGSGAMTVFAQSVVRVNRCTFTGNWNGVDDKGDGSVYTRNIFWKNDLPGGISPGKRYEVDIVDASGVKDNFIHGEIDDLRQTIDRDKNFFSSEDPKFDTEYRPRNKVFKNYGYDPEMN
jgi:hypothetical protein